MKEKGTGYKIRQETLDHVKYTIERKIGMTYEEFEHLNIYEQRKIINSIRKNEKRKGTVRVMIGSGEHAMFINVPRGTKIMLDDGTIVKAGLTLEEYKEERDKEIDKMLKPTIKEKVSSLFKK